MCLIIWINVFCYCIFVSSRSNLSLQSSDTVGLEARKAPGLHGYVSEARCTLTCGPDDASATHCLLLYKMHIGLSSWYQLTRVVPNEGPLSGVVVTSCSKNFMKEIAFESRPWFLVHSLYTIQYQGIAWYIIYILR